MEMIKTVELVSVYHSADSEKEVLHGVNLEIKKGSFVAVLGHNGSGKSTLVRHFNGIVLPESGQVFVSGMDTADEKFMMEVRRTTGLVFQNPDNQIVASVVEDDVAFAPENLGLSSDEIRKRVDDALKAVGMYEFREKAPHHLSGGQKQRIAIAGILAMKPECIVLDEPTAMLDPEGRRDVLSAIEKLRQEGITVVLITHHMREAIHADRVLVISDGNLHMEGTPEEVFSQVEELYKLGLSVPETTELIFKLKQGGMDTLSLSALTVEDCAEAIAEALKGK